MTGAGFYTQEDIEYRMSELYIYIATHKSFEEQTDDPIYIPLHVGKVGKPDLGYIGDDAGDNISYKNESFCELTGLYWMWKNSEADILGLCHYRRYFVKDNHIMTGDEIRNVMDDYDMIIATAEVLGMSVKEQFFKEHNGTDLERLRDIVSYLYPEYLDAFDLVMHTTLISVGNMLICRKALLDSYCRWLFDILFEAEKQIDVSGYNTYQKRIFGFFAERLLRVWLLNQNIYIKEENIITF
jgi:hypothetical protein